MCILPRTTAHIFSRVTPFSLAIWWRMRKLVIPCLLTCKCHVYRIAIKPWNILPVKYFSIQIVKPMPWLAWMWSYFSVVSALPCPCIRIAMTACIARVLCYHGMALRSRDFKVGAGLCFLGNINSLIWCMIVGRYRWFVQHWGRFNPCPLCPPYNTFLFLSSRTELRFPWSASKTWSGRNSCCSTISASIR